MAGMQDIKASIGKDHFFTGLAGLIQPGCKFFSRHYFR
jgi:hypothetical protein